MPRKIEQWHYFRAGRVERGARYTWRDGYARVVPGGVLYPWSTMREAQGDARRAGARATFHETEPRARLALAGVDPATVPACDKCGQPNDRATEGNYCAPCRRTYQERIKLDPETRPVGKG